MEMIEKDKTEDNFNLTKAMVFITFLDIYGSDHGKR